MVDLAAVFVIVGGYLLGAVPFGLLVARVFAGVDVRAAGSGNIGATNVARAAGKGFGVLTLVLDALKGAAPVLVADHVLHAPTAIAAGAGLASVLGHVFPIYLRFKGGKGVATGLGVFAALSPLSTLAAAVVFGLVFAIARVVSAGSLVAVVGLVVATVLLDGRPEVIALASIIALLVFVRHRGNIQRLISKTEHRI